MIWANLDIVEFIDSLYVGAERDSFSTALWGLLFSFDFEVEPRLGNLPDWGYPTLYFFYSDTLSLSWLGFKFKGPFKDAPWSYSSVFFLKDFTNTPDFLSLAEWTISSLRSFPLSFDYLFIFFWVIQTVIVKIYKVGPSIKHLQKKLKRIILGRYSDGRHPVGSCEGSLLRFSNCPGSSSCRVRSSWHLWWFDQPNPGPFLLVQGSSSSFCSGSRRIRCSADFLCGRKVKL